MKTTTQFNRRQFLKAAAWTAVASVLSFFGVIHAYVLTASGVQNRFGLGASRSFALAYLIASLLLLALHCYHRSGKLERTGTVA